MDSLCGNGEWLVAYLERRLGETERRSCEEHLADCPRCRGELVAIEAELDGMRLGAPVRYAIARRAISALAGDRISPIARIASRIEWPVRFRGKAPLIGGALVCAAAALVILATSLLPRFVPALDPDMRKGAKNLGAIFAAADIGDMRLVGQEKPPREDAQRMRGAGSPERALFSQTEESLRKALLRRPRNRMAYRMLGDLYLAGGEGERAGIVYRRALLLKPDDPVLLNNLAVVQFNAGNIEASRRTLERAQAAVDAPPEIWYNLAIAWREAGNRDEMRRYLELYLTRDGISPWAVKAQRMITE